MRSGIRCSRESGAAWRRGAIRRAMIHAKQARPTSGISTNRTIAGSPAIVAVAGEKDSWGMAFSTEGSESYFAPNESSQMSIAAVPPAQMASIFPSATGSRTWVKNSALLICPS